MTETCTTITGAQLMNEKQLDRKDEKTEMRKCSESKLDSHLGWVCSGRFLGLAFWNGAVFSPEVSRRSVRLPNWPDRHTACAGRRQRARFYVLQWGILEMFSLIPSGGNAPIFFHFRNSEKPLQVRWVPGGNAMVMEMLLRIHLCKYLFFCVWFMMCLVFPGYLKSNYNVKCVPIEKLSLSYDKLSETCLCENAIFSVPTCH